MIKIGNDAASGKFIKGKNGIHFLKPSYISVKDEGQERQLFATLHQYHFI
jgi:hypothetical protein